MARSKNNTVKQSGDLMFEEALSELEKVIITLEKGELPLEEALTQFESGMRLSEVCLSKLNFVEQKIDKIINEKNGKIVEYPLPLQEDE